MKKKVNKVQAVKREDVEKRRALIVNDHVNACKKAFAIACKEIMAAVAVIAPDEPAFVKPEQKKEEKKPQQKKQAVKRAGVAKITKKEADKAKPNVVKRARNSKPKASEPVKQQEQTMPEPERVHHRTPASVRLTPHEITLNIGGHPVKELAENDAKDFLNNPKIFWYRGMQFPDPKRYSVQPRIESARVVKRADPKFTRAPWTVSVVIAIEGDDKRCESWGIGVFTKNKSEQE